MSSADRVSKILEFINSNAVPESQNENELPKTAECNQSKLAEDSSSAEQSAAIQTSSEAVSNNLTESDNIDSYIADSKRYNSITRRLRNIKTYPKIIDNIVFHDENDLNEFKQKLHTARRQYNHQQKLQKIAASKMDVTQFDEIPEHEETIVEDNLIYSTKTPIGIVKNNKNYKIPRTNKRDRIEIYDELKTNPDVMSQLAKSDNEQTFHDITLQHIKNDNTKRKLRNHIQNDLTVDRTWDRDIFYKIIETAMQKQEQQQQTQQQSQQHANVDLPVSYTRRLADGTTFNPRLFAKY